MYSSISWVVSAGEVQGWKPRDVHVFIDRGNKMFWVTAHQDLHLSTVEVRLHLVSRVFSLMISFPFTLAIVIFNVLN